jgi:hypothetical protein
MNAQAARLAARLAGDGDPVERAWRWTLGRAPSAAEKKRAQGFATRSGLPSLCLLLFNMNEFVYVD